MRRELEVKQPCQPRSGSPHHNIDGEDLTKLRYENIPRVGIGRHDVDLFIVEATATWKQASRNESEIGKVADNLFFSCLRMSLHPCDPRLGCDHFEMVVAGHDTNQVDPIAKESILVDQPAEVFERSRIRPFVFHRPAKTIRMGGLDRQALRNVKKDPMFCSRPNGMVLAAVTGSQFLIVTTRPVTESVSLRLESVDVLLSTLKYCLRASSDVTRR